MVSLGKTIGSLQTWEPDDKSFSKHTVSAGQGDTTPNDGALCTLNIALVDEVELDEKDLGGYKLKETVEITIGEGDTYLSQLLDKVVCSMKEKEASYIKAKVDAQGKKIDELLQKNKQLKFNIILQNFNRAADLEDLESDEKLERAQHHKDKGTLLFKEQRLTFAVKRYKKAASIVDTIKDPSELPESLQKQCNLLKCQCYLNLGACYLKEEMYDAALNVCKKALEVEPNNVKGLFRKGQALFKLCQINEAVIEFQKVLEIEPQNKTAQKELSAAQEAVKKEKKMYQNMFK